MNRFLSLLFNNKDESTNDKLGEYPAKVHVSAMPERRYLNTTRIMTLLSVFSLCITVILALILYLLPPQITSTPTFAAVNALDNDIQNISSFQQRMTAKYLMVEKLVSDYVVMKREVVPNVEAMKARYKEGSPLSDFSSNSVFAKIKTEELRIMKDIQNYGLKREVKVLWVKPLVSNVWRVRYETIDTYKDREKPEINSWFAIVSFYLNSGSLSRDVLMRNPLGFIVSDYKDVKGANHPEDMERFVFEE